MRFDVTFGKNHITTIHLGYVTRDGITEALKEQGHIPEEWDAIISAMIYLNMESAAVSCNMVTGHVVRITR